MKKDEILNASRKEHRNKDLAEMGVVYQAGSHASRVNVPFLWFLFSAGKQSIRNCMIT